MYFIKLVKFEETFYRDRDNHEAAIEVSIMIQLDGEDKYTIKVHPALSLNGDGINDFLVIEGIKDFNENKIVVFTHSGLKVFEMKNYDNTSKVFKGKGNVSGSNGKLPEGTYFYILEYKDVDKWKLKKGWFELKM